MRRAVNALYFSFLLLVATWAFTEAESPLNQSAFFGVMAILAFVWIAFLGWLGHWAWQRLKANG